jgi:manganese/iron transport system substrate-binding protein
MARPSPTSRWALAVVAALAAGCASQSPSSSRGPVVITTVAPITDVVRTVAGPDARVDGVIPEGTDSHTFEPAPRDAKLFASADLVLVNGLHLESPTQRLARANVRKGVRIVELGARTIDKNEWIFDFSFPKDKGDPNPHLWMNPVLAGRYAQIAAEELGRIDPSHGGDYERRALRFRERIDGLDQRIRQAVATVPPENRKLLTYHDSFAYFAPRYGFTVIGAIQPSDFSEPSPQEVARLIDQIRTERVPAVFGSEVFPSPVLDQIARETGIEFVTTLRDDDLPGARGAPQHTYLGMMTEDVRKMVGALKGDPSALDGFDTRNR